MDPSWFGSPLLPEGLLAVLILVIIILDALFWPRRFSANLGYLTLCGLLLVLSAALEEWIHGPSGRAFHDLVFLDTYATFFDLLVLAAALGALLLALGDTDAKKLRGEFYPLLLVSVLGLMLTAAAADLLVVCLGLELASLPLWALAALGRRERPGGEAGLKFLILGLFGSSFALFGTALLYGAVGSTDLQILVESLHGPAADSALVVPGLVLLLTGLLFKMGVVPFHCWSPDLHEGSPLAVSAFVAAAVPAAAFAALGRVVLYGLAAVADLWMPLVEAAAVLSMVFGSLLALNQRSIRRLLAYIGIAQAGWALVGLLAASEAGLAASLFCWLSLGLALVGCYAVLAICGPDSPQLRDYRGLARRQPLLALGFALCLASLAGLPPTVGFAGRFYLLSAAIEAGSIGLALVLAGCIPLLFYACMRVVIVVFMRSPGPNPRPVGFRAEVLVVLLLSVLGILGLGLLPADLFRAAKETVVAVI